MGMAVQRSLILLAYLLLDVVETCQLFAMYLTHWVTRPRKPNAQDQEAERRTGA